MAVLLVALLSLIFGGTVENPDKAIIEGWAQETNKHLNAELGSGIQEPVLLEIASTKSQFRNLSGGVLPDWSGGVCIGNQIVLLRESGMFNSLNRGTFDHELVHVWQNQHVKGFLPRWLAEGLANYLTVSLSIKNRTDLARMAFGETFLLLSDADNWSSYSSGKAGLAYAYGHAAVLFFVGQFGKEKLIRLLTGGGWDSFPVHFEHVTGVPFFEFELKLRDWVREQYLGYVLLDAEFIASMLVPLLLLAVWLSMRARNRATFKRWENEERNLAPETE